MLFFYPQGLWNSSVCVVEEFDHLFLDCILYKRLLDFLPQFFHLLMRVFYGQLEAQYLEHFSRSIDK